MIKGIGNLKKIQVGFSRFSKQIEKIALIAGFEEMVNLEADMVERTPVDKGHAQTRWSEIKQSGSELAFELSGIPYALVLDIGSTPGAKPWPGPGPRTALYKGRVFSSQVADGKGGITAEVLTEQRKGEIAEAVLDRVELELLNALDR
jgi:hypothetical protein